MEDYNWYNINNFFDLYLTSIPSHIPEFPFFGWEWDKKWKRLEFTKFTKDEWFTDTPEFHKTVWPDLSRNQERKMIRDIFKLKD